MKTVLSRRIREISPSATMVMFARAAELRAEGKDIIGFNVGEPDFPTPEKIRRACIAAIDEGKTKYTPVSGVLPLREAICKKLKDDNGLVYKPSQICVGTGAKQELYNAVLCICGEGDEVIIPKPCWVSYVEIVKLAGAVPVLVDCYPDYSLNVQAIEAAVTERTKAVLINTPNNPTGACYTEAELRALGELACEKDFYVISDEVYEKLIYDGAEHVSIAALSDEIYERTILINGFSKAFSMTGWRLGYVAASEEIIKGISSLQGHSSSNSTTFVQWAAITALEECAEEVEAMRKAFEERRDYLYEALLSIPDIKCGKPAGAFYMMPDVSAYLGKEFNGRKVNTTEELCGYLLDEAGVALVQGDAFFMPGTVRFSYANSMENLKRGVEALKKALAALK